MRLSWLSWMRWRVGGLTDKIMKYREDIERRLTCAQVSEMYSYNPDTGNIRHLRRQRGIQHGRIAGSVNGITGYVSIKIGSRLYKAHRVAWLLHYGDWPCGFIDHINELKGDNRIANLRVCTPSQNHANTGISIQNTTGHKNVSWSDRKGWRVRINCKGKRYEWNRRSKEDAIQLAREKRVELFGEFANHG